MMLEDYPRRSFCNCNTACMRARLAGKATGQGCRAKLPGKAAGQGCMARVHAMVQYAEA
jgi:hypothetical protein